jgi:hypothetical protein
MTAGARGSSAASLPARPVAHQWLQCGRYAQLMGLLLRPSNLSRHLQKQQWANIKQSAGNATRFTQSQVVILCYTM